MPSDLSAKSGDKLIMVRDREGTGLPFSKGLMATSILVSGMKTEQAYRIAAEIEGKLAHRSQDQIEADDLAELAKCTIERRAGVAAAHRFWAWRQAKRTGRPVIVAMAGAPGVGKSTLATRLAVRLGITRVITTDTIREVLRTVIPAAVLPELHVSTYETTPAHPDDPPLGAFHRQARAVSAATVAVITRLVTEHTSAIVEGVHLVPGFLCGEFANHPAMPIVVETVVVLADIDYHRAQLVRRAHREPSRDGQRHLQQLSRIRDLQEMLISQASASGIAVYDIAKSSDLTQRIVDQVVTQTQEPEQSKASES